MPPSGLGEKEKNGPSPPAQWARQDVLAPNQAKRCDEKQIEGMGETDKMIFDAFRDVDRKRKY